MTQARETQTKEIKIKYQVGANGRLYSREQFVYALAVAFAKEAEAAFDKLATTASIELSDDEHVAFLEGIDEKTGCTSSLEALRKAEDDLLSWGYEQIKKTPEYKRSKHKENIDRLHSEFVHTSLKARTRTLELMMCLGV